MSFTAYAIYNRLGCGGSAALTELERQVTVLQRELRLMNLATQPERPPSELRVRILALTRRHLFYMKSDQWFYHTITDPAKVHPNVAEMHVWGTDYEDYDSTQTLRENLVRRFGSVRHFDMVVVHIPREPDPPEAPEIRDLSRDVPVFDFEHECWEERCALAYSVFNASAMVISYAPELLDYGPSVARWIDDPKVIDHSLGRGKNQQIPRLMVHIPHHVPEDIFLPGPNAPPRENPVIVTGFQWEMVYPLRWRLTRMIQDGRIPGYVRPHPGYSETMTEDERAVKGLTLGSANEQVKDYARALQNTKIVLVDASAHGYALRKYMEAAMAGALVMGDIPMERQEEFRRFVVPIDYDDSDEEIIQKVNWWLGHDRERTERAEVGQFIARRYYTGQHYVDKLLLALQDVRAEKWGLKFSYPFKDGCRAWSVYANGRINTMYCQEVFLPYGPYRHECSHVRGGVFEGVKNSLE